METFFFLIVLLYKPLLILYFHAEVNSIKQFMI